jgi:hypothetical protein
MLTHLAGTVPPHIAHTIARWLGIDTVIEMFCQSSCCPEWTAWAEIEETAA